MQVVGIVGDRVLTIGALVQAAPRSGLPSPPLVQVAESRVARGTYGSFVVTSLLELYMKMRGLRSDLDLESVTILVSMRRWVRVRGVSFPSFFPCMSGSGSVLVFLLVPAVCMETKESERTFQ